MQVTLDFKPVSELPDKKGMYLIIDTCGNICNSLYLGKNIWRVANGGSVFMWAEKPAFKTKTVLDMGE